MELVPFLIGYVTSLVAYVIVTVALGLRREDRRGRWQ